MPLRPVPRRSHFEGVRLTVQQTRSAAEAPAESGTVDQRTMVLVFITVLLGMLLSALDQTIVSTALPTIVGDLGGAGHLSWVVTVVPAGRDRSRRCWPASSATCSAASWSSRSRRGVFVVGSALCGLATSMTWLIAWRAVQGLGRGRPDGHRDGADRRRHPAARARQVPGRARRGLRRHDGDRAAARRAVHRPPVLAVGVLRQRARSAIVVIVAGGPHHPAVKAAAEPVDRLPGHRLRRARRRRPDPGHRLGRQRSTRGARRPSSACSSARSSRWRSSCCVEPRAAEPILPMRLFRSPVFTVCSILSFIVGFAMLGAMTFLPTYLQYVKGVSATASGVRTLPMVLGPAGHLDRLRHRRRPDRPVQDLPDRRLGCHGARAVPAVPDGRGHRVLVDWRSTCSCSASASACACRC